MRVFKNKKFRHFAEKEKILDQVLCNAVRYAANRRVDADLGGNVIKQRLAREGQGKSGRVPEYCALPGEPKERFSFLASPRMNEIISGETRKKAFKALAKVMLALDNDKLAQAVKEGEIKEVICDE